MRSQRYSRVLRDDGAFCLEKKDDVAGLLTERFEVALPLGEDQVSRGETPSELLAAIRQHGAWCIRAVVDDLDDFAEADGQRVDHGSVVEDWSTPDRHSHPLGHKLFDEQAVKDNLARIISQVEDLSSVAEAL